MKPASQGPYSRAGACSHQRGGANCRTSHSKGTPAARARRRSAPGHQGQLIGNQAEQVGERNQAPGEPGYRNGRLNPNGAHPVRDDERQKRQAAQNQSRASAGPAGNHRTGGGTAGPQPNSRIRLRPGRPVQILLRNTRPDVTIRPAVTPTPAGGDIPALWPLSPPPATATSQKRPGENEPRPKPPFKVATCRPGGGVTITAIRSRRYTHPHTRQQGMDLTGLYWSSMLLLRTAPRVYPVVKTARHSWRVVSMQGLTNLGPKAAATVPGPGCNLLVTPCAQI